MDHQILLITPVRNEVAHIDLVARSVAAQTSPPDKWIVVDDGSTDGTYERLAHLAREIPFMRLISAPPNLTRETRDRLAAAAAPRAFNFALRTVRLSQFSHIGKLDGDCELSPDYFERLLDKFALDATLGIAGGVIVERSSRGGWHQPSIPREHVRGALKLYSAECLTAIGGVRECCGWDAVDEVHAQMAGFRASSFSDLVVRHHRPTGTADGRLRGRRRYGEAYYFLGHGALQVTLKALKFALAPPRGVSGVAFIWGYLSAAARSAPRLEDEDYRRFVRRAFRDRLVRACTPSRR